MVVATLFLPLAIAPWWGRPPADATAALWLLGLFAVSIGLPFFALSANGPLLQAWFARTDHPAAANPVLSLCGEQYRQLPRAALLSVRRRAADHARPADAGLVGAVRCADRADRVLRVADAARAAPRRGSRAEEAVRAPRRPGAMRARWIALAAVPSALLISVTAHISTDIAAAPFMWVIPLALYLVTFVIVFQTKPVLPPRMDGAVEPMFIVALVGVMVFDIRDYLFGMLALNVVGLLRHHAGLPRRAGRSRPAARHLTAFYMWMSAGGVIGGIFAGLIAPHVFSSVLEYPALIVLAILCRPGLDMPTDTRTRLLWLGAAAVVAVVAFPGLTERYVTDEKTFNWTDRRHAGGRRARVARAAAVRRRDRGRVHHRAGLSAGQRGARDDAQLLRRAQDHRDADGRFRVFLHGTTIHGAERLRDDAGEPITGRPPMITYYHVQLADGRRPSRRCAQRVGGPIKVAVVGLGTGTFACFSEPGDNFKFYEIDASVQKTRARSEPLQLSSPNARPTSRSCSATRASRSPRARTHTTSSSSTLSRPTRSRSI